MMNKKTITSLIIILVIAVITEGLWYTKNQKNTTKPVDIVKDVQKEITEDDISKETGVQEEQKNENVEDLKVEDIDTSNWKTYRNEELGFEMKYSEGWVYDSKDGITFFANGCKKNKYNTCPVMLNIGKYNNVVSEVENFSIQTYRSQCDNPKLIKINHIDENIWSCQYKSVNSFDDDAGKGIEYHFVDDDKGVFEINITYRDRADYVLMHTILQTLKLIN